LGPSIVSKPDCLRRPGWATRLAGLRIGAFWKLSDPAWISLPGSAWLGVWYTFPLSIDDVAEGEGGQGPAVPLSQISSVSRRASCGGLIALGRSHPSLVAPAHSSRAWTTPPAVYAMVPAHHGAMKALARVASAK